MCCERPDSWVCLSRGGRYGTAKSKGPWWGYGPSLVMAGQRQKGFNKRKKKGKKKGPLWENWGGSRHLLNALHLLPLNTERTTSEGEVIAEEEPPPRPSALLSKRKTTGFLCWNIKRLFISWERAFEVDGQPHPQPSPQWHHFTPPFALQAFPPLVLFNPHWPLSNWGCQFPTLSGWLDVNGRCLVKARLVVGAAERAQRRRALMSQQLPRPN